MAAAGAVARPLWLAPQSVCHMCSSSSTSPQRQPFASVPLPRQKTGLLGKKEYLSGCMQIAPDSPLRRERVERARGVARAAVAVAPEKGAMSKVEKWGGDKRLQTQTAQIAQDTTTIRSLDWDRDRFDMCVSRAGSLERGRFFTCSAQSFKPGRRVLAVQGLYWFLESLDPIIDYAADVSSRR
jgi:hypothetical protein